MKKPLVSVIMPVYNAGKFLKPAIDSILGQTFQDFELIVVDDASSDNSLSVLKQYKKRYPFKFKIIEMNRNLNCGGDRCANEGLKIAKGTYIARMDADDVAHKNRLEKQVEYLRNNKEVFLVGSNAYVIDRNGRKIGEKNEPSTHEEIYNSYFSFHPLIHPTCMMRRSFKSKKFKYKLKYNANNDYLTFFTLLCNGAVFHNLPEKLLYYRIHGKNDTFIHMKQKFLNTMRIRIKMIVKYGYRPGIKAVFLSLIQTTLFLFLPEKVLFTMYLTSRGIIKKPSLRLTYKSRISLNPSQLLVKKATA